MLRGILINKIRNNKINIRDVNNFVNILNSRINNAEEIHDEEYYFNYLISDKYPKNLKIRMPKFESKNVFYLFYKYDKQNHYKLGDTFKGVNCYIGGINDIAEEILRNDFDDMIQLSIDIGTLFYQNICQKELINEDNLNIYDFIIKEVEVLKKENESKNKMELLERIASGLIFIKAFHEEIFTKQKENSENYQLKLDDFYNLLNRNKLMNCSNIFTKEKELNTVDPSKGLFSPSFIFYINNNQSFINELFNDKLTNRLNQLFLI